MVCQYGAFNNSANGHFDGDSFLLKRPMTVRVHAYLAAPTSDLHLTQEGTLTLQWCEMQSIASSSSSSSSSSSCKLPQEPLPYSALTPTLPPAEVTRRAFQASALAKWGSWLHRDILSIVLLPDSAVLALQLCHLLTGVCQTGTQIDGNGGLSTPRVRVGAHALDHSYSQAYVAFLGVNVSVEYTTSGSTRGVDVLVTPQSQGTLNASEYVLVLAGSFAWGRQGSWVNTSAGLNFCGLGLPPDTHAVTLTASHPPWDRGWLPGIFPPGLPGGLPCQAPKDCASGVCSSSSSSGTGAGGGVCAPASPLIHFPLPLDQGPVGVTTNATTNATNSLLGTIVQRVGEGRAREYAKYSEVYGEGQAGVVEACVSALGWRHIFVPCEVGGVMPVTYGFSWISPSPSTNDWAYVLFDWDNYLASFTAAVASGGGGGGGGGGAAVNDSGGKQAAYSNAIQITKAATSKGYIPNWAAGGSKAQQSEPALGSWTILQLFTTYGDTWLVELLYPELLDWHHWQWEERRVVMDPNSSACPACCKEPGFITVGNDYYPCPGGPPWDGCVGNYKGESGLDQSPLWDCPGADEGGNGGDCTGMASAGSHLLTVGEVQSTSLFIVDAMALATLAKALNRSAKEVGEIEARADAMRAQLATLYNPDLKAFLNVNGATGAAFPRLTPTMFYPLMTGAATPQQALDMVSTHLLNASTFCVGSSGGAKGCHWGLPSIAVSDPAFMQPQNYVYWRGLSWGPMALLTYLSLAPFRGYDPVVEAGVSALVAQKRGQFVDMWERNRHVCENYSPFAPNSTQSPGTGWDGLPKSNGECTGWEFYTWGALNGVVALLEEKGWGGPQGEGE